MPEAQLKKAENGGELLVWDQDGEPPKGEWIVVLWSEYRDCVDQAVISIPQIVEKEAEELRSRYLAWIHDLGESAIEGKRVVDHLSLRPGFSYWWMAAIAQKFNISGTSLVNDAIKALALEALITKHDTTSLTLFTSNRPLAECIKDLCNSSGRGYKEHLTKNTLKSKGFRPLYRKLPYFIQNLIYLIWLLYRSIRVPNPANNPVKTPDCEVIFFDVLVHLDHSAISSGKFSSNYWTSLVNKLNEWKIKSNWLHMYFRHPTTPNLKTALKFTEQFTNGSVGMQNHMLIEQYLTLSVLRKVISDVFKLRRRYITLRSISEQRTEHTRLNLFLLHNQDWRDSTLGAEAVSNCLRLSLFDKVLNLIPPQKLGVFISENQPWEMALLHSWKACGHGTLISVPHTTVRFWDLRYFYDPRTYVRNSDNSLPLPDILAINGPVAHKTIVTSGYPELRITEVEALRFMHLLGKPSKYSGERRPGKPLRVLVFGDFLASTNETLLKWLEIAALKLPGETHYTFKPHPAYLVNPLNYTNLPLEVTDLPLISLLDDFDVVYTSNTTSASADAYCAGKYVVQMLDGKALNTSPLRNFPSVMFVTSPTDLYHALIRAQRGEISTESYFHMNEGLYGWREMFFKILGYAS